MGVRWRLALVTPTMLVVDCNIGVVIACRPNSTSPSVGITFVSGVFASLCSLYVVWVRGFSGGRGWGEVVAGRRVE